MTDLVITESDVRSFQAKLEQWGAELPDGEGAILHMVMARAFPEMATGGEPEVEGFADRTPRPKGKAQMQDFTFTHHVDKASPILARTGPLDSLVGLHVTILDGPSL